MADRDEKETEKSASGDAAKQTKAEDKTTKGDAKAKDEAKPKVKAKDEGEAKRKAKDGGEAKPKAKDAGKTKDASRDKDRDKPKVTSAKAREPEPAQSNNLLWLFVVGAIALGGWWLWRGRSATPATTEPSATPAQSAPPAETTAPMLAPPPEPVHTEEAKPAASAPAAETASAAAAESAKPEAPSAGSGGATFDRAAALKALAKSGTTAAGCRMRGESAGTVQVAVTFDPSGSVKGTRITNAPYVGSGTGKCVEKKLSETKVEPFSGESAEIVVPVQVH